MKTASLDERVLVVLSGLDGCPNCGRARDHAALRWCPDCRRLFAHHGGSLR